MRTNGNGTRRPDEILAEIERTRSDMDDTLGQIERRLTPGQLLDQGMEYLKSSGAGDYVRNLRGSVSENPIPVALAGIGLAWLMAADRLDRRRPASADTDTGSAMEGMKERAEGMKAGLHARAEGAKASIASMRDRASGAMDQARSSYDRVVTEQPLALGAIGLAIGAVMAAALPRTRREDDLLSGTRETIADKASEVAAQAKDKGREMLEKERAGTQPTQPDMAEVERAQFKAGINGGPNPPVSG